MEGEIRHNGLIYQFDSEGCHIYIGEIGKFIYLMNDYAVNQLTKGRSERG